MLCVYVAGSDIRQWRGGGSPEGPVQEEGTAIPRQSVCDEGTHQLLPGTDCYSGEPITFYTLWNTDISCSVL